MGFIVCAVIGRFANSIGMMNPTYPRNGGNDDDWRGFGDSLEDTRDDWKPVRRMLRIRGKLCAERYLQVAERVGGYGHDGKGSGWVCATLQLAEADMDVMGKGVGPAAEAHPAR